MRRIMIALPSSHILVEVPIFGKIKYKRVEHHPLRGESSDLVIIDEKQFMKRK